MKKIILAMIAGAAVLTGGTTFAQVPGADTYKAKCLMCHAADGTADSPTGKVMKTPSFKSPDILKMSSSDMIAVTKSGKGKMPAYNDKLTDAQIKDVIAYVHTLQK
jgi:cytochrome c6